MGQELHGGRWSLSDRSTRRPAHVDVDISSDRSTARVSVRATLAGRTATLHHHLDAGDPTIVTRTEMRAPSRRTVTLVARQAAPVAGVSMHQPGGMVERPLRRWYDPTYWPLHSFATNHSAPGDDRQGRLAVATATPTGIHLEPDGTIEVVVARTAVKEVAFGVVPVMAPAWGRRWGTQSAVVVLGWHEPDDRSIAVSLGRRLACLADRAAGRPTVAFPVEVDDPDVEIIAVKPADRGDGAIVRIRDWASSGTLRHVLLSLTSAVDVDIASAHLSDSRERDTAPLLVHSAGVDVPIAGHITTVRISTSRR